MTQGGVSCYKQCPHGPLLQGGSGDRVVESWSQAPATLGRDRPEVRVPAVRRADSVCRRSIPIANHLPKG